MQIELWGKGYGPFVFGREVLKKEPAVGLKFCVQQSDKSPKSVIGEWDFWDTGVRNILEKMTRFGRIGIFFDRKNKLAGEFFSTLDISKYKYDPKDRRAAKKPCVSVFETLILWEMANEAMADSVEFRRLARKYLRKAKHIHCDTIFFPEAIMGEEKTRKILQHIVGTQMKCVFVSDFVFENEEIKKKIKSSKKRNISIISGDDADFTGKRAEGILRTKLKQLSINNYQ